MAVYAVHKAEAVTEQRARNIAVSRLAREAGIASVFISEDKITVSETDDEFIVSVDHDILAA